MPALQPPSMQIGGPTPGFTPGAPTGPALADAYKYTAPLVLQQVINKTTGAAQPTSASLTIAATTAGSTLVALIGGMAQGGSQNQPTPTNFTNVANTQGGVSGVLSCNIAMLANCAAGITNVTWPTLTNFSSAVYAVIEIANAGAAPAVVVSGQGLAASSTGAQAFGVYTPALGSVILVALLFCNSAQSVGNNSTPGGKWNASSITTSTNSQGSVVNTSGQSEWLIVPAQGLPGIQPSATIGGATAIGCVAAGITSLAATSAGLSPSRAQVVDNGGTYGVGDTGGGGFALGGTKPGGAGGGN